MRNVLLARRTQLHGYASCVYVSQQLSARAGTNNAPNQVNLCALETTKFLAARIGRDPEGLPAHFRQSNMRSAPATSHHCRKQDAAKSDSVTCIAQTLV